jgi:hypothetical protein
MAHDMVDLSGGGHSSRVLPPGSGLPSPAVWPDWGPRC